MLYMILFFSGKDTYRSRRHIQKLVEKFTKERDPQGYNIHRFDCEKTDEHSIRACIKTPPFISQKKLVIIDHPLSSKYPIYDLCEQCLSHTAYEDTIIIFWEPTNTFKQKKAKIIAEQLAKQPYSQTFDVLELIPYQTWIKEYLQEQQRTCTKEALVYIAMNTTGDTWAAAQAMTQLMIYNETGVITLQDAELFIPKRHTDTIFSLVDAIIKKQKDRVFSLLQEQYDQGTEPQFVFAMIHRQVLLLLELKELEQKNQLQQPSLATTLGIHPFVIKKTIPLLKGYAMEELKQLHEGLRIIDTKTKTGQGKTEDQLIVWIGKNIKK